MIKSIAYFPLQAALNSKPVLNAFLDCCQAAGIQTQENSFSADAAVIWSVLWHGRMAPNKEVYEHYRREGKPVIIIDIGALYRGKTWKIAVNHITGDGFYGHTENLNWDRPKDLQISKAITIAPKNEIIIAAQHSKSLQTSNIPNIEAWVYQKVAELKAVTDRPLTVRPHPRCRLDLRQLPPEVTVEHPHKLENTYDSFDMHFNCHAVVNYNSGPGIQAAIAGCRPIVDKSSLAHPVGILLNDLESPYNVDRDRWLVEICHTEYTVEEIKKGLWLKRIEPALCNL